MRARSVVPAPGLDSTVERAVDERDALAHADQAEAAASSVAGVEARAVVAHEHFEIAVAVAHADLDAGRAGVLGDVGQRLLDEPVDGRLDLGRVARRRASPSLVGEIDVEVDGDWLLATRAASDSSARLEAELVQRRRPQVGDQRAQVRGCPR